MSWFRRDSATMQDLRDANAELGDQVQELRRQLSDAVQQAANSERSNQQLGAANEKLAVELARANGQLSRCNAERLHNQVLAAAAERAGQDIGEKLQQAEDRIRRAVVILAQPGVEPADAAADALRVLEGGEPDG